MYVLLASTPCISQGILYSLEYFGLVMELLHPHLYCIETPNADSEQVVPKVDSNMEGVGLIHWMRDLFTVQSLRLHIVRMHRRSLLQNLRNFLKTQPFAPAL
jgi:hypothetical protein